MIQFYLFAFLFSAASVTSQDVKFQTCNMAWRKIGCFRDLVKKQRTLPEQLVNIRDIRSKVFQPPRLDWTRLSDSWRSLACQCAKAAREKGYKVFGLQFYGECWSGMNGTYTYKLFGNAAEEKCVMDLQFSGNKVTWKHCDVSSNQVCVGKASTNYVYVLDEVLKSPGDGGWSEWGDWTQCDKTCGTGKQDRERTCTNPPPDPQGRDCEGPAEESRSCNLIECPIDGGFTSWEPVPECTKTCGGGFQKFVRTCTNPPPQHGGNDCHGPKEKTGTCNDFACPIPCTRAIDLGVILDATNSVGRKNFVTAKQFVLALVNSMKIAPGASHLGLIVYNIQATIIIRFNETAKQDPAVIEGILKATTKLRGRTFTDRALRKAGEKLFTPEAGDRPVKPDVLVVLTDGKTNPKSEPYETAVESLKAKGVKVIAVGVGTNILPAELTRIAMGKKENVVRVSDFKKLFVELQTIINSSCQGKCARQGRLGTRLERGILYFSFKTKSEFLRPPEQLSTDISR